MLDRYHINDAEPLYGKDFASLDPGRDGAYIMWTGGEPVDVFPTSMSEVLLADAFHNHGIEVLVTETQYVHRGSNGTAIVELSWRSALQIGVIAGQLRWMDLVECSPSTWQASQRRRHGVSGALPRKEGICLALKDAEQALGATLLPDTQTKDVFTRPLNKSMREGVSSSYGIGRHWLGLQTPQPEDL